MLYRGMFVIQSCCLKSDMDVLTAYFGLYLSQKAFRLLAFKFSHIFGLSRFFGSIPQISPFFIFLWYVFNLCKLVMSHILALSSLLSHIDSFSYCYYQIIYVFLTIFLYLLKCPQSLILSALRAFCLCGKPHISRLIFLYFPCQSWLKSW